MLAMVAKKSAEKALNKPGECVDAPQLRLINGLKAGLEKITSTMGCHELRGYGRVCSSIGLAPSVAAVLQTPNYFGSETAGLTWERLERESAERGQELRHEVPECSLEHIDHFYPKLW